MRLSNLVLNSCFVLILAFFIPSILDFILPKSYKSYHIDFSPVFDEFVLSSYQARPKKREYFIIKDQKNLSEDEYMASLPFDFYSVLIKNDNFPSEFDYFASDIALIRQNSQYFGLQYKNNLKSQTPLFALLESNPKNLKLQIPSHLIDISDDFVFINTATNEIDKDLSDKFKNALLDSGAKFNLKGFYSNPNLLKSFDEGAFVVDKDGQIFHILLKDNEPIVKNTQIICNNVVNIAVSEHFRKEFYGALVCGDEVSLISYDNYRQITLSKYLWDKENLLLKIDPLFKHLSLKSQEGINLITHNPDFSVYKQTKFDIPNEKIDFLKFILPFEISLKIDKFSRAYEFGVAKFNHFSLILSLILAVFVFYRQKDKFNAVFVAITGIYGFLILLCRREI
nr:DUF4857 domain-containing protein [Campylobacter sp.]